MTDEQRSIEQIVAAIKSIEFLARHGSDDEERYHRDVLNRISEEAKSLINKINGELK